MGAFPPLSPLRIGKRTVESRVLILFRTDPRVASRLLPPDLEPRLTRGHAVVDVCYTRLAGARVWPGQRIGPSHHLALRVAAARPGGESGPRVRRHLGRPAGDLLVAARQCGGHLLGTHDGRARFRAAEDPTGLALSVRGRGRPAAHAARVGHERRSTGVVRHAGRPARLPRGRARRSPARPPGPRRPTPRRTERRRPSRRSRVQQLDGDYLAADERLPAAALVFDSVWRLVTRRTDALPVGLARAPAALRRAERERARRLRQLLSPRRPCAALRGAGGRESARRAPGGPASSMHTLRVPGASCTRV